MTVTLGPKPWSPWPGCETLEWRSYDGQVVRFLMRAGARGRLMPPVSLTTLPVPGQNGSRLIGSAHLERPVAIPVAFPGPVTDRAELRRWAKALDPNRGEGTLTVVDGTNPGRFLRCNYEAGLEDLEEDLPSINLGTLVFRATWPYWLDSTEQITEVTQGSAVAHWFPFLPLILGASDAFALFTVNVTGDVPSWPVVNVTGPGTDVRVENKTTGKFWQVTGALAAGSRLTVDTRPSYKQVSVDGVNAYPRLAAGSSLWPLAPGGNQIQVSMALTNPTSKASFTWRNAWLAA